MKIIIGAGQTRYDGWVATQVEDLDVLDLKTWSKQFEKNSVDAMLAEHVWEHMSYEDGKQAAVNCFKYLKDGAYIRCAVPDGHFNDEWYQNMVQIGGPGPANHPASGHKVLYTYEKLREVFEYAGFEVELLEYCDENNKFHYKYWNELDGMIGRSFRFDTRNSDTDLKMVSIIIDAKKPLTIECN